jgi:hypothetical protein
MRNMQAYFFKCVCVYVWLCVCVCVCRGRGDCVRVIVCVWLCVRASDCVCVRALMCTTCILLRVCMYIVADICVCYFLRHKSLDYMKISFKSRIHQMIILIHGYIGVYLCLQITVYIYPRIDQI